MQLKASITAIALVVAASKLVSAQRIDEFLRDYPNQSAKIEEYYSNGIWTARVQSPNSIIDAELKSFNDLHCLKLKLVSGFGNDTGNEAVCLRTPSNRSVLMDRFANTEKYVLSQRVSDADLNTMINGELAARRAPFILCGVRLVEWLKTPSFKIIDLKEGKGSDGAELWTISFEIPRNPKVEDSARQHGWFTVNRSEGLVVTEFEVVQDKPDGSVSCSARGIVSYASVTDDEFPNVVGYETWAQLPGSAEKDSHEKFQSVTFRSVKVPESDFKLSTFGIRDVEENRFARALVILGIGVVLGVFGVLIARWSKRTTG